MSHFFSHLLRHAGHVAVHALAHRLRHHQAAQGCGMDCAVCREPVSAEASILFDCCGMRACYDCASRYVTPLGDGEFLVECRCGARRRSRPYQA